MNLGLEFWLEDNPLSDSGPLYDRRVSPPDKYQKLVHLGFCKLEDKWQVVIKRSTINYEWDRDNEVENEIRDEAETVALSKAPRNIRLLAVERFDDLLEGLNRLAAEKIDAIERAASFAEARPGGGQLSYQRVEDFFRENIGTFAEAAAALNSTPELVKAKFDELIANYGKWFEVTRTAADGGVETISLIPKPNWFENWGTKKGYGSREEYFAKFPSKAPTTPAQ
jgi:hypothetical protein